MKLTLFARKGENGKAVFKIWDSENILTLKYPDFPIFHFNTNTPTDRIVTLFVEWYKTNIEKFDKELILQLSRMFVLAIGSWSAVNGDKTVSPFNDMIKNLYMSITNGDEKATEKNYNSLLVDVRNL